jgi:hypothetical protein
VASLPWLACSRAPRATSVAADASALIDRSVRVPAALSIARALDTLSVAIDPETLGQTEVSVHPGTFVGVEAEISVFAKGHPDPVAPPQRRAWPGTDFNACAAAWSTARDGIPQQGAEYVVEMALVLFETNVPPTAPPAHDWAPRAGTFEPLWTRTLRQAEE